MTETQLNGFKDEANYGLLRKLFHKAKFDHQHLANLGYPSVQVLGTEAQAKCLASFSGTDNLECFVRLFLLHQSEKKAVISKALAPLTIEDCIEAGILMEDGDSAKAAVMILPYHDFVVLSDWPTNIGGEALREQVMCVSPSTESILRIMSPRACDKALDLGSGTGVAALFMSKYAKEVVATDVNPRAVEFTRQNALLNSKSNITAKASNFFDGLDGESFDLIACNPPLVISPEDRFLYRDSELVGDEFCQKLIEQAPAHLKTGGVFQLLCNWVQDDEEKPSMPSWIGSEQCDVHVLSSAPVKVDKYADTWLGIRPETASKELAEKHNKWMDYYKEHNIKAIGQGVITIRKVDSEKGGWKRLHPAPPSMDQHAALDLLKQLELTSFLVKHTDNTMLGLAKFKLADGATWNDGECSIVKNSGFRMQLRIDPNLAHLAVELNGKQTLGQLIHKLADLMKTTATELNAPVCGTIRSWISLGLVWPMDQ